MIANDEGTIKCHGGGVGQSVNQFVESVTDALAETEASEEVVMEVEEAGKELAGDVEQLETEVRDQPGAIQELRRENQQLRSELSDYRESNELDKASIRQRVNEIEEETGTGDANPGGDGSETSLYRPESPLENVVSLPETMVESELSANQERARFLARDVSQYATKVPAGRSLDYSTIKKVLKARGDTPHGQTVIRVMDFLDRLGKDGTEDVKRRGKRRIVFSESAVERLERLSGSGRTGEGRADSQGCDRGEVGGM